MVEDNKTNQAENQPLVPVEQTSFVSLGNEVTVLKQEMRDHRSDSRNIIVTVVVAAIFVFMTIGVEIMIFHTR